MITGSHYPKTDNGLLVIGPRGDHLDSKWAIFVSVLANAEYVALCWQYTKVIFMTERISGIIISTRS
jgi:hypothetical protein